MVNELAVLSEKIPVITINGESYKFAGESYKFVIGDKQFEYQFLGLQHIPETIMSTMIHYDANQQLAAAS